MAYKNVYGFNTICTSIKNPDTQVALSQNLAQSFYILHYLLCHDNDSYEALFLETVVEDFARRISNMGFSTDDPKIKRIKRGKRKTITSDDKESIPDKEKGLHSGLIDAGDWKTYFMNKGHNGTKIEIPSNLGKFLDSLTKYLISFKSTEKYIDFEHFNTISNNLKLIFESNLIKTKTNKKKTEQEKLKKDQEKKIFNSFFDFIFDENKDALEQAITVQPQLVQLSKNDPYAALTWIMLFSLYPKTRKHDQLADILDLFSKEYAVTHIIVPSIIDRDSHSYDALKTSMAEKYKCDVNEIENNRKNYFDKEYQGSKLTKGTAESFEYLHLMLLYIHSKFRISNEDRTDLESLLNLINYAIEQVEKLGIDDESYWLEYIQFNIEKIDIFWKLSDYNNMHQQIIDLDKMLYYKYKFTDQHRELLAILKRKEGVYFNRIMDFESAVRVYSSSFFLFDESMKLQRSIVKNNEAYMYRKWMKLDKSKQSYKIAYELKKDREKYDPESVAVLRANMSRTYILCHEFDNAEKEIKAAYNFRHAAYSKKPEIFRWKYCYATITYAELYTLMGVYKSTKKDKLDYFSKANEKLLEAELLLGDNPLKGETTNLYYLRMKTLLSYHSDKPNDFSTCLDKLIKHHSKDIALNNPRLIPLYIYRGKQLVKEKNYKDAFKPFEKAYKIAKGLSDEHPANHLYSMMVSEFHLGALLSLHAEDIETENTYDFTELLMSSKEHIEKLMDSSDNIAKEDLNTNRIAFCLEEEHIKAFLKFAKNENKDIAALRQSLIDFFVVIQ